MQADLIVEKIQEMLGYLRAGEFDSPFANACDGLLQTVEGISRVVRASSSDKEVTDMIDALQTAGTEIRSLSEDVQEEYQKGGEVRSLKQKLASASYEIAKRTKELVGMV